MYYTDTNIHTLHTTLRRVVMMGVCALVTLFTVPTMAQVVIGGNVYGGGNQGELEGNANVELKGGTIQGNVFGGARMADVTGRTYVHINGADAKNALIVKAVYGGNDISGTIGTSNDNLPFSVSTNKGVDNTWNAFIRATQNNSAPVIIGALYGGGNGAYEYTKNGTKFNVTIDGTTYTEVNKPTLGKAYLELKGGIYGSVYGGGNAATVTDQTVIYANDSTAINGNGTLNSIPKTNAAFLGLFEGTDYTVNDDNMVFSYHINRMFGGNNLAEMAIRPTWDLQKADINNLYSGGNRGNMTYLNGIAIAIQSDGVRVNNVYGGCRMADVNPGETAPGAETIYEYPFDAGYAARVYITGGKINNVYGGNDISGKVYHGTNVEIHGAISGDIYGGGNGSYAYTDKESWVNAHPEDADYYYEPGSNSLAALYQKRPHVEKTLVHVAGTEGKRVVVAGGLFCGGNSATLAKDGDQTGATATFKIGKYVDIQQVYLGSNGKNMISDEILNKYADADFTSLKLTESAQFKAYMEGVTVNIIPYIEWDNNLDYQTRIGSFFCGGNVGSMTYDGIAGHTVNGKRQMEFPQQLVIFDKIVAGCNSANIAEKEGLNAAYTGGLVGSNDNGIKVRMLVRSRLQPGYLDIKKNGLFLESAPYKDNIQGVKVEDANGNAIDANVYAGANVYGGCYASGYINGGVEINVDRDLISPDTYKDDTNKLYLTNTANYVYASAMAIYGGGYGEGTEIRGSTSLNFSGQARALLAFGGGQMGTVTGNAVVNLDKGLVLPGAAKDNINVYRAYAGGYAGEITGNTTLNLLGGGVMRAFAGACNANVKGYTTAIIGHENGKGLPYVTEAVFGGNDFGGKIEGNNLWTITDNDKKVRSQSYVKYVSGEIGEGIYGGSYGSYKYTENTIYTEAPSSSPAFITIPTKQTGDDIATNTFVDIASQSTSDKDIIGSNVALNAAAITMAAGGGRGYANLPDNVKVSQTYVLLHAANGKQGRTAPIAHRIYGGGNLSTVVNTQVDAYSGNVDMLFGGTHGVKTLTDDDKEPYNVVKSVINTYTGLDYADMDVFGAGANSGSNEAVITLNGGTMRDVHGGAYTEGYTPLTRIDVPATSTVQVNAIYGGGYGEEEGRPCDVGESNITFQSGSAKVEDAIYGGNHTARVTTKTNIAISVPVKNFIGELRDVYGAGYGEETVSGFTEINLNEGAQVANVYGGGREGKVYNHYKYFGKTTDGREAVNIYYSAAPTRHGHWINGTIQPQSDASSTCDTLNTTININDGAIVHENVYGGGKGDEAYVSGRTNVNLLGGTVKGDIYGGGDAGAMPLMAKTTNGFIEGQKQVIATYCEIKGGEVRNVFGGGFKGNTQGNTNVAIGILNNDSFSNGNPTIQRSAYGGGEMAKVTGTSTVKMYNGYIGYKYDKALQKYEPLVDLRKEGDELLKENGNLYGAGYGEGAIVMNTCVRLYDGTVRNGLYGGGEIAAVGVGHTKLENEKYVLDTNKDFVAGKTNVYMYGGKVEGDVFGGGRGFSYDLTGNEVTGKLYYTDGYVFGATNVEIYRGVIGTDESVKNGHGNVFGGGNIGYVYSAGTKYAGGDGSGRIIGHYYYATDDPTTTDEDETAERTEDCRVHITARCLVTAEAGDTINGHFYAKGEYVTTEDLNTLAYSATEWNSLDTEGLTIRNAVFAGGNVSSGSDKIYANAVTVYGNATAAVIDVFAKDFVRLGGEHVGGLYGDGNLTFVDGYRELNITNYGTDYYNLTSELTYENYLKLTDREKDYYTLMYELKSGGSINFTYRGVTYSYEYIAGASTEIPDNTYRDLINAWVAYNHDAMELKWDKNDTKYTAKESINFNYNAVSYSYSANTELTKTEYESMMTAYTAMTLSEMESNWDVMGVCAITAGRMMNTIQRADFCGVFGSRMVLHGAQDRVPDVVDYTNYTINRVAEVSLNRVPKENPTHGNYFGIYNVVNFLGAFTSDVEFKSPRRAENGEVAANDVTYYDFKNQNLNARIRNNATSDNMVAMASGAYLELVKELDEDGNKVYGPVTGVIQLDMINVKPGEGGGYVYAKNEHGEPKEVVESKKAYLTLSDANEGAITHTAFTYKEGKADLRLMQTSGNFVHPTKRIVDDCFPRGGYYDPDETNYSPAHYWYVRGDFYVYDQYLSAYTGAAEAYPQSVNIPLTITAGSEGKMQLVGVNPNKYAYFDGMFYKNRELTPQDSILVGATTYHMNDPISYWDWSQLTATEQSYFVDSTYVAICDATINGKEYTKDDVLLPDDYRILLKNAPKGTIEYEDGKPFEVRTDSVFRISNELSHKAGYLLTFDMTNPLKWDDYYTTLNGTATKSILESEYKNLTDNKSDYIEAPTLLCNKSGIYGQQSYKVNDIVHEAVIEKHEKLSGATGDIKTAYDAIASEQATFEPAYVVIGQEISFTYQGNEYHMYKNSYVSETMYRNNNLASVKDSLAKAYICVNTIEVADKEYVLQGELISEAQYQDYVRAAGETKNVFLAGKTISNYFSPAYVCTDAGKYGGTYFQETKNYHALQFSELPYEERNKVNKNNGEPVPVFKFNYDALDLLATDFDPLMSKYGQTYSSAQPVNYEAKYIGRDGSNNSESYTYKARKINNGVYDGELEEITITENTETAKLQREDYERILNEKAHFFPINVTSVKKTLPGHTNEDSIYYIVKEEYEKANIYYPVGKVISEKEYNLLTDTQKGHIQSKTFDVTGLHYYCVEDFVLSSETKALNLTELTGNKGTKGTVIKAETFNKLPNYQVNFIISGHSPVETSTLYVARESDINNLSKDRVITVEYKYTYREADADGSGYETFIEKHVVNIHVQFKSGLPTIGDVTPPATVLPNSVVGLSAPTVTRGAYEILGGGWEMFESLSDATEHKNGVEYKNNATPMYWYQNNYYVAYFAKTYLGKAYSNPVPFSVANYHRLGEVMNHEQRMYIDHKDVERASKIYLDAAPYPSTSIAADFDENDPLVSPNGKRDGKNDLDYLYDLYQETKNGKTSVADPTKAYVFDSRIENASNLEFILRSDIAPKKYAGNWMQIGDDSKCFAGTLHGNGYTISGLDKSLFKNLCGSVYNLGVTGSFTGGGVADNGGTNGYAENCWVYTTNTPEASTKAVIGDGGKIVNSYYLEDNGFEIGKAIAKTKSDFEKGEVAYQLNRFHLHKRFSEQDNTLQAQGDAYKYMYYVDENDELELKTGYYKWDYAIYPYGEEYKGYVEDYYIDGDFIYANGEIPFENNERFNLTTGRHYPIYPDDYIFFGQRLSYQETKHNDWPMRINKQTVENRERIVRGVETANRVYRAPAYYLSQTMDKTYFNIFAAFADSYKGVEVGHNMTAIDFTGHDDNVYTDAEEAFYKPYLDYEGLQSFSLTGLTPNLLVYANPTDVNSYQKIKGSLTEPILAYDTDNDGKNYYRVAEVKQNPRGHLVDLAENGYVATSDHFLVDKENFNAPIKFQYADNCFMWYQRTPDRFAENGRNGWDVICLPFTAGLVTTHQKGEITHFYEGSTTMHEYWLRELKSVATEGGEIKATFARPAAGDANDVYPATNDFLYEYYYSKYDDANADDYQQYYKAPRNYVGYAYLTKTTPYIIAFPGKRYYEFDMSGTFVPENTANRIDPLQKQVVTMVSAPGTTIAVTDDEKNRTKEVNGYHFVGTYQKENLSNSYLINDAGDSFVSGAESVPFRGYLVKTSGTQDSPKRIFISGAAEEDEPMEEVTNRGLTIYGKKDAIYIESTLEHEATVVIYGLSGQVVARVTVQPMSKEVVKVPSRGVYIVNKRKVAVL